MSERIQGLAEMLMMCDLDYLRSVLRSLPVKRRREFERAARMSDEERLAKMRLSGHVNGKKSQAMFTPEERRARMMKANKARWPKRSYPVLPLGLRLKERA